MSSFRLGNDGTYQCVPFHEFAWQRHGFGTRAGNATADVTLRQTHSNCVWNATGLRDRQEEGDALVSDEIGLAIGVRTADCVPILLLDSRRRAVAAVHAGWRGTAASVVRNAIERMARDFGTVPEEVYAAVGPCIRRCCYEVAPDVAAQFRALFPEWDDAPGKRFLDLAEANRREMISAGVRDDRIFDCGLCTACEPELYSYRREPENPGRMVASICRIE